MVKKSSNPTSLQTAVDERKLDITVPGGWIRAFHMVYYKPHSAFIYQNLEKKVFYR